MTSKATRRFFLFLVFLGALLALSLVAAGFASDNWAHIRPLRKLDNQTQKVASSVDPNKLHGYINLGLFRGKKQLDGGLVKLSQDIDIMAALWENPPFWNVAIWVCILVFGCLSLAWALVTAGFALLNISRKPVETISGPLGLYLWNLMGILFTGLCVILFAVLFHMDIQKNVLTKSEQQRLWSSTNTASLAWSFWLVVAAIGAFALNLLFVFLAGVRLRCCTGGLHEKTAMDGVMMY